MRTTELADEGDETEQETLFENQDLSGDASIRRLATGGPNLSGGSSVRRAVAGSLSGAIRKKVVAGAPSGASRRTAVAGAPGGTSIRRVLAGGPGGQSRSLFSNNIPGDKYDDKDDLYGYGNRGLGRYGRKYKKPFYNEAPMAGSLDVYVRSEDDSEDDSYGRNKYDRNRYGDRKKPEYSRVRFPVRRYPNPGRFPLGRFPSLISILPSVPIFYDRLTYQTFIFAPTGGVYILPPLINFYGRRFAVAQLIQWGYASLVSTGAPPPPNVNVAPLVQPEPAGGPAVAGVIGNRPAQPAPAYNSAKGEFIDGVKTEFPAFKPRYPQVIQEGANRDYRASYASRSNYRRSGQ